MIAPLLLTQKIIRGDLEWWLYEPQNSKLLQTCKSILRSVSL